MTKESRSDIIYRWSMTKDLQEFVRLGKELHPELTEEFWTQAFKDSVKTGSQETAEEISELHKPNQQEKDNILTQEEISRVLSGDVTVEELFGLTEEEVTANMARGDEGKLWDD